MLNIETNYKAAVNLNKTKTLQNQNNTNIKSVSNNTSLSSQGFNDLAPKYPKAQFASIVSFSGNETRAKNRGLMMHIAHLPATKSHIGQFLDPETENFTTFLKEAKQTHWIINPLTPIGEDLCPYNSSSRFDRNKYFVNLNVLTKPEYGSLLKKKELPDESSATVFTMEMLKEQKDPRFELAFKRFKKLDSTHPMKIDFNNYIEKEGKNWLDNSSIHEGIINSGLVEYDWRTWPDELKMFPEKTQSKSYEEKLQYLKQINIEDNKLTRADFNKIEQFRFEQFLFDKQFKEFKKDLDSKDIKLFVDLAYAISPDGKDVWANKDIVALDKDNNYEIEKLTGCMPEAAYPNTQMWGQAVWNFDSAEFWDYQEKSIRKILEEGCVRLDHFGGLINRGAIPTKVKSQDGKDYPIFEAIEKHIELEKPYIGVDGKEKINADKDIWRAEWLEDVSKKTNSKGENLLDLYIRVAEESGLKPEDSFIVEDLGGVCETATFSEIMSKYNSKLSGLRLPSAYGIESSIGYHRSLEGNPHNPWGDNIQKPENFAILSGSHDPPTMMETIEINLSNAKRDKKGNLISPKILENKKDNNLLDSSYLMVKIAQESGMKLKDMKEKSEETYYDISRNLLEWMYKKPAKHMQTTISDALGIYFRPNMPGSWNGHKDKYYMKQTQNGMFDFWSTRFAKGFLTREDKSGIKPGYKDKAQNFIDMMNKLYPKK